MVKKITGMSWAAKRWCGVVTWRDIEGETERAAHYHSTSLPPHLSTLYAFLLYLSACLHLCSAAQKSGTLKAGVSGENLKKNHRRGWRRSLA
jgi:hypothetical protein